MSLENAPSRGSFVRTLAGEAAGGKKALLLAPLGAGKTQALLGARDALVRDGVPFVFIDLFTAASTPERMLEALALAVSPFMGAQTAHIEGLRESAAKDRHQSSSALLRLLEVLSTHAPAKPFVWLVDEVTEIRSLAYFPDLGRVEAPFANAIGNGRGALVTSSYLGLARDLFPDLEVADLPPLGLEDLAGLRFGRGRRDQTETAITVTGGGASTLIPLLADLSESKDVARSLTRLLRPGEPLEILCRRHYEVLLMRSRGYAVSKRAAEVVATARDMRLTDLFPRIGRTAGASRQYLRWLVEVGLLIQSRKRYNFADPVLGLWASLYLGRAEHPTAEETADAVRRHLTPEPHEERAAESTVPETFAIKRPDRFEEFD